ncbi:hypothetical protein Goklo_022779 [Gossypium klotzschianum]|uniref:RNase H type-1 domain-containing protein n=1 Tax=Gossypium klotzschianum TaxID=34286 RepID=A0A7J8TNK4_9ROSI|nr:hypothetical protein [Gossypium klotzschianum]
MAEARTCLQAIIMAKDMRFQDICIEGDALNIIRKLNSRMKIDRVLEGGRYEHHRFWIEEAPHTVEILTNQEKRNDNHGG